MEIPIQHGAIQDKTQQEARQCFPVGFLYIKAKVLYPGYYI